MFTWPHVRFQIDFFRTPFFPRISILALGDFFFYKEKPQIWGVFIEKKDVFFFWKNLKTSLWEEILRICLGKDGFLFLKKK